MGESPLHGPLFGRQLARMSAAGLAPFGFQTHALRSMVAGHRLVVRLEAVDVVAFGLVFPARKVAQIRSVVHIVFQIAVGGESELAVAYTAEFFEPFRCHVDDPKPLSGSEYILLQMPQDGGEISCADRLHVADPVAAPDLEADDQKAVHYAPGGFELELPAKHVGERQVAVRRGVRQCEGFDFGLVFDRNGFEGNHKLSSTV